MIIIFHKDFEKQYKKLSRKIQIQTQERIILFEKDRYNSTLNNHALNGTYAGYRSINISGNIRIIYKLLHEEVFLFVMIGTHTKLYS